ncbi:hypothetical protein Ciccas_014584, partial [Cichlidogyrus casuarinus]
LTNKQLEFFAGIAEALLIRKEDPILCKQKQYKFKLSLPWLFGRPEVHGDGQPNQTQPDPDQTNPPPDQTRPQTEPVPTQSSNRKRPYPESDAEVERVTAAAARHGYRLRSEEHT